MEEQDPDTDDYEYDSYKEYWSEENCGKVSWMLNRGINVGKKILVTGVLISSAPIVLPPLVVISVIGFAVSVPSGLFLASYACTDKVMSKLLPGPKPPPFLLGFGNDENGEGQDLKKLVEDIDLEKEEQEQLEDTSRTVEMRINLTENSEEEEDGYKEDIGVYVDNEVDEESIGDTEVEREGVTRDYGYLDSLAEYEVHAIVVGIEGDERIDRNFVEAEPSFEVSNMVVGLCENANIEEDEELVRERNGLVEKIRHEGLTENEEYHNKVDEGVGKLGMKLEDMAKPLRQTELKIEENKHKTQEESMESQKMGFVQDVHVLPKEMIPKHVNTDLSLTRDFDDILQAEISVTETTDVISIEKESQVLLKANDNFSENGGQDVLSNTQADMFLFMNADARETVDESRFCVFDNKEVFDQRYPDSDYYSTIEELEQSSSYATPEGADFAGCPIAEECISSVAGVSSQKDIDAAHRKLQVEKDNEKKIWEQIEAMRKIIGYKAAPQATCFEELKALYLFTGVEPPASFNDPSDISELDDKLRFLMSIVGVKY